MLGVVVCGDRAASIIEEKAATSWRRANYARSHNAHRRPSQLSSVHSVNRPVLHCVTYTVFRVLYLYAQLPDCVQSPRTWSSGRVIPKRNTEQLYTIAFGGKQMIFFYHIFNFLTHQRVILPCLGTTSSCPKIVDKRPLNQFSPIMSACLTPSIMSCGIPRQSSSCCLLPHQSNNSSLLLLLSCTAVRPSEKSSINTNRKSPMRFPTSLR